MQVFHHRRQRTADVFIAQKFLNGARTENTRIGHQHKIRQPPKELRLSHPIPALDILADDGVVQVLKVLQTIFLPGEFHDLRKTAKNKLVHRS